MWTIPKNATMLERTDNKRNNSKTAGQCLSHLYMSKELSDIIFTVNDDPNIKLHAHKFVLSMRSEVFKTMFYGAMAETRREIELPDIDSSTMKALLRYIYSDEVNLDGNVVLQCLYAAKKYAVDGLIQACTGFLERIISCENVCIIHEMSKNYDLKDLQKQCFEYLLKHGKEVLCSPSFLKISKETLKQLLEDRNLYCDEKTIFLMAVRWAECQCKNDSKPINPANLRSYLDHCIYQIRFALMPLDEFALIVAPTEILTNEEQLQLFKAMALRLPMQSDAIGSFVCTTRGPKGQPFHKLLQDKKF